MLIYQDKKIISHRGNLHGPNPAHENNPNYILNAIKFGFEVEVDIWYENDQLFLGHDSATYKINHEFLNHSMWVHCKNLKAVELMRKTDLNWFWHDLDKMTLTNKNFVWCYSGVYIKDGITVECGHPFHIKEDIMGICTDYPINWKKFKE